MKNALIEHGIPDSIIYMVYAGFRTFDSVIRRQKIFRLNSFTVISQKFHNQRAIYIAQVNGFSAAGYNAQDASIDNGFKNPGTRQIGSR
ncbi:MAG: YdcF family protein [Prevotellaceae bacterium]|jgi:SanA protein|nr:YdcF family protein [Prevotellaceae bacterium]